MADAIFSGIRRYFYNKPPPGTWVAAKGRSSSGEKIYIISRGDTLSEIAARHNVSVAALLRHNGMSSTVIRVGQRIKIPQT
jgi:N-acetylmuramoyl-L-alanine amidase